LQVETVVYFDPDYPSKWINKKKGYPQRIAQNFSVRGKRVLNANELKAFIVDSLEKTEAFRKIIVFSQDIAPWQIVESYSSANTLREYLDAGGSVLWIGDIPLYYKGLSKREIASITGIQLEEQLEALSEIDISREAGPTEILGIIPIFGIPKTSVSITRHGNNLSLKTKWSGMRPIVDDKGIRTLAKSESVLCRHYIEIERRKNIFRRIGEKIAGSISVKAMDVEIKLGQAKGKSAAEQPYPNVHQNHPNAWVKNFNSNYPDNGFYRIWDYPPTNLTDKMIDELYSISQNIETKISNSIKTLATETKSVK
jgi:hypothetical protein